MGWRLSDYSIQARFHFLGALVVAMMGISLGFSVYMLNHYRVEGPRHVPIKIKRDTRAEVSPSTIYLVESYLLLQEMETDRKPEDIREHLAQFDEKVKTYETQVRAAIARLTDVTLRNQMDTEVDRTGREFIRVARAEYLPLIGKADQQEKISAAMRDRVLPAFRAHRQAAVAMDRALMKEVDRLDDVLVADANRAQFVLLLISGGLLLIAVLVGVVTARGIIRSTQHLLDRVNDLGSGASDLTARLPVESNDELGQLAAGINRTIEKIHAVVSRARESSIQLLSTASEIAATARQQDATVQGLSSATTQVAAAVREITATSKELSSTMCEVNERAEQAATLAESGRARLAGMEQTMGQLVDSTASISSKLSIIREKADNINVVVTTITKVADQTNLLSINAAIEAEKAGEYGRGFLVVAREIRRLADQTAVATLDIESMVRHMQEAVSTGVMQMDKFSDEVRSGVGRVAEINGQTGQIIDQVHGLTERFHNVNEGMRNQSIGAEQINEAMVSMTGNIRQTATALEEFNRATAHLRSSVEALNGEITQFKT